MPKAPIFPPVAAWKTLLDDNVEAPLAADSRRVFVATRDGVVRALDATTGSPLWKVEGYPGRLSAGDGVLFVRDEKGTVTSLHPRNGEVRWRTETGVAGTLPVLVDRDRVHVAGRGLASLLLETGAPVFVDAAGPETTAPPVAATSSILTGEADGTLRCRDRATGTVRWTLQTRAALEAPPLVDERRKKLYLGTTDKRILEASLADGDTGWTWRIGADAAKAGLLLKDRVLFAPYDAVLYSLERGGNLAWRAALPSRPLSAPMLVDGRILVACLENLVVAVWADTGVVEGAFKTPAEIRTEPILVGGLLVVGMRDRSVIAYDLTGKPPAPVEAEPAEGEAPAAKPEAPPSTPAVPPKPVEAPPPDR